MKKRILIGVIVGIILLVLFFFPKNCGYARGGYVLSNPYYNQECTCLGFKYETCGERFDTISCADMGINSYCAGIHLNKKCFEVSQIDSEPFVIVNEIKCDKSPL